MTRQTRFAFSWEWLYFYFVLALWVFTPEIRRVIDFQRGTFASVQALSVVPLAAIIPLVIPIVRGRWRRVNLELGGLTYLWLLAFTYALLVGAAVAVLVSAAYTFLSFCIPAIAGLWVATQGRVSGEVAFRRIARALLWMGTLSSLYGILEFVAPPAWDLFWLRNADIPSAGAPEAFSFRIFGTLNSQGPFADFLAIVLMMNLDGMRLRRPVSLAAIGICVLALAFSLVRSAWIAFAVGLCLYLILSHGRWRAIAALPVLLAFIAIPVFALSSSYGDEHTTSVVVDRVNTLTNLQNDDSGNERFGLIDYAFRRASVHPAGEGLGVIGLGTKLTNERLLLEGFDNGYLARFVEMGYVGGLAYGLVVFGALGLVLRRWWKTDPLETRGREIFVLAAAAQIALLALDLASDAHNAVTGVLFWIILGAAFATRAPIGARDVVPQRRAYRLAAPQIESTA